MHSTFTRAMGKTGGPLFAAAVFLLALWLQSGSTIADPDALYHAGMIELTAVQGVIRSFPWAAYTTLMRQFADHHWLYHVVGVPFSWVGTIVGYRIYTAALAAGWVYAVLSFLMSQRLRFPIFFSAAMIACLPFIFRLSSGKATALSLLLSLGIIVCAFSRRYTLLALTSAIYALSYGGFALGIALVILYAVVRAAYEGLVRLSNAIHTGMPVAMRIHVTLSSFAKTLSDGVTLKLVGASLLGSAVGVTVHPNFPATVSLVWEQLVQIGIRNYHDVVSVGIEWLPLRAQELFGQSALALALFATGLVCGLIYRIRLDERAWFFFSAATALLFLSFKSQRYIEYFIPFALIASAYGISAACGTRMVRELADTLGHVLGRTRFQVYAGILIAIALTLAAVSIGQARAAVRDGIPVTRLERASVWLREHSAPGDIVFHARWDDFAFLWFWNKTNYYIVGLDPTFMYLRDRELYAKYRALVEGAYIGDAYETLSKDFHARFVLIPRNYNRLEALIRDDSRFVKAYTDDETDIYELN